VRRVYADPITGKAEWGLVKGPEDRIMGVYSRSDETPLKQALFPDRYQDFEDKSGYHEWQFVYSPPALPGQPQLQPQPTPQLPPQSSPPAAGTPPTPESSAVWPEFHLGTKVIVLTRNQLSN
jgi:hypothetical protein